MGEKSSVCGSQQLSQRKSLKEKAVKKDLGEQRKSVGQKAGVEPWREIRN